jgi:hypothetical protein
MADQTPILSLPLILPSQAQKHVTHNEALRLLDVAVQLAVLNRTLTVPPATPSVGDRHIVANGATGSWAGQAGRIAVYTATGWQFFTAQPGWVAFDLAADTAVAFTGTGWVATGGAPSQLPLLGINTPADGINRLAVSAAASLFSHGGSDHQMKVNKATAGDTASLLFQTNFSGRAEMGLAGSNDFSVKVSANGNTWSTAFTADATDGRMTLPSGLDVTGSIGGSAVQASAEDAVAGRLMKVGAFGLGAAVLTENTSWDGIAVSGLYRSTLATTTGTPTAAADWYVLHMTGAADAAVQIASRATVDDMRTRYKSGGVWSAWISKYSPMNLLGTVSQSGGVPTGAVIQRGSSANGEFVRFADGTQICTRTNLSVTNASTALGSLFRSSANVTWTYPSAFIAAPVVTSDTDDADSWAVAAAAPTTTSVALRAVAGVTKAAAITIRATAVGRWF